ncbi:hypothetical protein D8T52_14800 [Vibrio vulnificus]|uniref:hypothetical protein n=1 Tax=Vibrio vulnificus TaxID=672 RepID=UPI0010292EEC|nr:hypothetical protein [Vibrio vulnificus]RZP75563.1 hypothetical protein D8T52_14800 [Vibrio vulnificus]HDY7904970.1 hypothetical protein [Vibrio vulnificus]HDY7927753.1 hypothetical protein [Vibrio vulnificus]
MSDFIIQAKKNRVQANRVIGGELESILFAGELAIPQENFWDLFKKKIEYVDGEILALVIVSDNIDFQIDVEISIAESFEHSEKEIGWLTEELAFGGAVITSYPQISTISDLIEPCVSSVEIESEVDLASTVETEDLSDGTSLQAFYRKKTRDYRRR